MSNVTLTIATTWDGVGLEAADKAVVTMLAGDELVIEVDAPFAGDRPPHDPATGDVAAPGRTDRLWEHEVVEVFIAEAASRDARYLELELGPHGHWLALAFAGYRQRWVDNIVLSYEARIEADRWRGRARLSWLELSRAVTGIEALNAYAIRGAGAARRYMAAWPAPAGVYAGPDFHRIEHFK